MCSNSCDFYHIHSTVISLQVVSYERSSPVADTKEELVQGEEKLTALQLEYTHLLSSQLESQRQYFEDKIAEAQSGAVAEVTLYS